MNETEQAKRITLLNSWFNEHDKLETLLHSVSPSFRNKCVSASIYGFYDKKFADVCKIIEEKTGAQIKLIRELVLAGNNYLIDYHIKLDQDLYKELDVKNVRGNLKYASGKLSSEMWKDIISYGFKSRVQFKKEFKKYPLIELTTHMLNVKKGTLSNLPMIEEILQNQEYNTRDKLRKLHEPISSLLYGNFYFMTDEMKRVTVTNILRQRQLYYGIGESRLDHAFDMMGEAELRHHLNISINLAKFLGQNGHRYLTEEELVNAMITFSINEAKETLKIEGIKPSQYKDLEQSASQTELNLRKYK